MAQNFERKAGTGITAAETGVNGQTSGLAPRFETLPNGDVRRSRDISRRFTPNSSAGTEVVLDPSRPKAAARELGRAISGARAVTRGGRSLPDVSSHSWSDDWGPDVLGPDIQPDSAFISQGTFDAMVEADSDGDLEYETEKAYDERMETDSHGRPGSEFAWGLADEWVWNGYSETYEGEGEDWFTEEEEMALATEPGVYGARTNGHGAEAITDQEASLLTEKDRRALARQRQFQGDAKKLSDAQLGAVIEVTAFEDPGIDWLDPESLQDGHYTSTFTLERPVAGPRRRVDAWSKGRYSRSQEAREWHVGRSNRGPRSQQLTGIDRNWGEVNGGHVSPESVTRFVSVDPDFSLMPSRVKPVDIYPDSVEVGLIKSIANPATNHSKISLDQTSDAHERALAEQESEEAFEESLTAQDLRS